MIATKISKVIFLGAAAATSALVPFLMSVPAEARGGSEYFVQTYELNQPAHGVSGRVGRFYCDYQRLPNRQCTIGSDGREHCKIKSWTLRQHCY